VTPYRVQRLAGASHWLARGCDARVRTQGSASGGPARRHGPPPRLQVRRLPEIVPVSLGLYLLASSSALQMVDPGPNHVRPFNDINGLMMLVALPCGVMLLKPALGRRLAALFVALVVPGAAAFLAIMDARGFDVRGCGWLAVGQLRLAEHVALLAAIGITAAAVFLREETRASDARTKADARRAARAIACA